MNTTKDERRWKRIGHYDGWERWRRKGEAALGMLVFFGLIEGHSVV